MPNVANRSVDARFQRSSSALREALLRVLDRAELAHVTVQMIVKEAGIGYATFFRHHPSLESLLLAVADAMIGDVAARIFPELVRGNQEGALAEFVLYVEQNRRAIRALLVGGGGMVIVDQYRRSFTYYLTDIRIAMHQDFLGLSKHERQVRYNHIEDIKLLQSFFGRIFGFGTVVPVTGSGLGTGTEEAMYEQFTGATDDERDIDNRSFVLCAGIGDDNDGGIITCPIQPPSHHAQG